MNPQLQQRIITAIIFLIVMLSGIFLSSKALWLLFGIINAGTLWEYREITDNFITHKSTATQKTIYILVATIIYCCFTGIPLYGMDISMASIALALLFGLFIPPLFNKDGKQSLSRLAFQLSGLLYITVPTGLAVLIAHPQGVFTPQRILGILLLIWVADSGAYFAGTRFGKTKLFPRISPNKSWEGVAGGALAVFVVSTLWAILFSDLSIASWWLIGLVSLPTGIFGDLIESMLKRNANVKDSGKLLPGHGGLFDRFDAFLFSLPFIFATLHVFIY